MTIEQIRKPGLLRDPKLLEKFNIGWDNIRGLQKDSLIIRDVNSGNDIDTLERHINRYQTKFPNKKLLSMKIKVSFI